MSDSVPPVEAAPRVYAPRPDGYRARLTRRIAGAVACVAVTLILAHVALSTATGQMVDTLLMESVMTWGGSMGVLEGVVATVVSVPAMIAAAAVVAAIGLARRRPTLAGRAVAAVVGATVTTQVMERMLDRPDLGVVTHLQNSLPSGHTTVVASLVLALVIVSPSWMREPAAWIGWAATALTGVVVMASAWHRPADVAAAVLVSGAWALALAPLEHRPAPDSGVARTVMGVVVVVLLVLGTLCVAIGTAGVDLSEVSDMAAAGRNYGFEAYLASAPWRARLLAIGTSMALTGLVGALVHEVDRLSWR